MIIKVNHRKFRWFFIVKVRILRELQDDIANAKWNKINDEK